MQTGIILALDDRWFPLTKGQIPQRSVHDMKLSCMMTSPNGKHFPRYWPFVRGIHQSPVNSPHKGQWRGALMFSLICVWINRWVNYGEAGDLRRHRAHYDVILMECAYIDSGQFCLATAITWKRLVLILSRNKRRMIQATSGARGYFIGLAWQWRRTYDMTYEA